MLTSLLLIDFLKRHSFFFLLLISVFVPWKELSYHSDIEDSQIISTQICLWLICKISVSFKFRKDDEWQFWKQYSYLSLGGQELLQNSNDAMRLISLNYAVSFLFFKALLQMSLSCSWSCGLPTSAFIFPIWATLWEKRLSSFGSQLWTLSFRYRDFQENHILI